MTDPEREDKKVPLGGSGFQQYGSTLSSPQFHGSPHLNVDLSDMEAGLQYELQEGAQTDYLHPTKLYSESQLRRAIRARYESAAAESVCSMMLQILVPFLLAGLGTVSAGMLLEVVQNWDVFQDVSEILILVPALLGMKGNLEMTLASRLSTAVNAGRMESTREMWTLIAGNLSLKQLQATVLGLLAAVMASVLGWLAAGELPVNHAVLLCSASVSAAFVASLLQGIVMVGVIMGAKRIGINPDNVATPLAAGFGDLVALVLLAGFSQWFYSFIERYLYVLFLVDLFYLSLIPVWITVASKHPATEILLRTGWEPIVTAMVISSLGGLILDKTASDPNLAGIVVYVPVINGVGGNLVSIQSSRISTNLHMNYPPGEVPENREGCFGPWRTFFGSGGNHRSAQILLFLVIPGQLIFLHAIHLIKGGHTLPSPLFTVFFLSASLIQVSALLCMADCMVHALWRRQKDPDSYSIPYLTALGDLLGTGLLSIVFLIL